MKVVIHVNRPSKAAEITNVEVEVEPRGRIIDLKERVSNLVRNPFSSTDVLFASKALADDARLAESGVQVGGSLDFVINASEQTLCKQLADLLDSRPLSVAELGLLYSHQRGFSVGDALQALGRSETTLREFLDHQKCFHFDLDDRVSVSGSDQLVPTLAATGLCIIPEETVRFQKVRVSISLGVQIAGGANKETELDLEFDVADNVARVKESVALEEMLPFPDQYLEMNGRVLDDHEQLMNCGVGEGSHLRLVVRASEEVVVRQFVAILQSCRVSSPNDLSCLYCCRYGVTSSAALKAVGLDRNIRRFLSRHAEFRVESGCVTLAQPPNPITQWRPCYPPGLEPETLSAVACSA